MADENDAVKATITLQEQLRLMSLAIYLLYAKTSVFRRRLAPAIDTHPGPKTPRRAFDPQMAGALQSLRTDPRDLNAHPRNAAPAAPWKAASRCCVSASIASYQVRTACEGAVRAL